MAAIWSGIGDTKKAMSGYLMSWLCTTMMLCEVTIAAGQSQSLQFSRISDALH